MCIFFVLWSLLFWSGRRIILRRERDFVGRKWNTKAARQAWLNYVVLLDGRMCDADQWFDAGCSDGRDWDREYSWLSA